MADSIILRKVESVERCLSRIREDYIGYESDFLSNQMRQDAIILNLQRACELTIDLGNHLIKLRKIGVPQESRSRRLVNDGVLSEALGEQLKKMVSFRNVAIHQYRILDLDLTQEIINNSPQCI